MFSDVVVVALVAIAGERLSWCLRLKRPYM